MVIIFCVLLVLLIIPKLYLLVITSETEKISNNISSNSAIVAKNNKIIADINSYTLYNKKVETLTKVKVNVTDKVKGLQKYITKDVFLTNLLYSKGILTLNGTTADYASISSFVANLQMSQEYKNATIVSISTSNDKTMSGNYVFTINIDNIK